MENIHQRLNYDAKGPSADEDYKTQLYHIPPRQQPHIPVPYNTWKDWFPQVVKLLPALLDMCKRRD